MEEKERFLTVYPKNKLVATQVSYYYYYFHQATDEKFRKNILYHPHYVTALNVYKGADLTWNDHSRTLKSSSTKALTTTLTLTKKTSMESIMVGTFDKIGIIFNPLGINHFLDIPLSSIAAKGITLFDYFGSSFTEVINQVYMEEDLNMKRELLDEFFVQRYSELNDQRIVHGVRMILENDTNIKIQDLAMELEISRKTLLRLFKKHLCCSVEDFKSTVKFRKALEYYQKTSSKPKLTQVALDNEYYDQSDFINHFKAVTGFNPKSFFSNIKRISNAGTYWTFLD